MRFYFCLVSSGFGLGGGGTFGGAGFGGLTVVPVLGGKTVVPVRLGGLTVVPCRLGRLTGGFDPARLPGRVTGLFMG